MLEIPKLVSSVLESFRDLLSLGDALPPDRCRAAQSHLSKFKIWAGSLGAHHSVGHRSLEYRLSGAPTIRNHVLSLLQELCNLLREAYAAVQDRSPPGMFHQEGGELDADLAKYFQNDDDFMKDEATLVLDQIQNTIHRLMRLSLTIRNPASYDHFQTRELELVEPFLERDIEHVQNKFPRLHAKTRDRIGKALTDRRFYFRYRENHNSRLKAGLDNESHASESRDGTTEPSLLPKDRSKSGEIRSSSTWDVMSELSATSYAPSSTGTMELLVPQVPREYIDGPFQCPYCFLTIEIEDRDHWKRHVFSDLRPYVCLAESCYLLNPVFERRKDWFHHMLEHCRVWTCPFGCPGLFITSTSFRCHITESHETHASPSSISTLVSDYSRVDINQIEGKCPVCYEVDIKTTRQYQSHVGNHLEQLALFVLPRIDEGDDSDEKEDQPSTESESEEQNGDNEIIESTGKSVSEGGSIHLTGPASEISSPAACTKPGYKESRLGGFENIHQHSTHGTHVVKRTGKVTVFIWDCCRCGHGGMNYQTTPACIECTQNRCGNCRVQQHSVPFR